jgi:hypothetical protein
MSKNTSRRDFIQRLGLSAVAFPLICNLPSLGFARSTIRKRRLVLMFSPNGVYKPNFWPEETGVKFSLKPSLSPLEPLKARTLILRGLNDKITGQGDQHQRGIGSLLTGIELLPGNTGAVGNDNPPAGWSSGISIDQEIKNYLQRSANTKTRFGSLEFGVMIPNRNDNWNRWVYAGRNRPVTPITNPYQMFKKLYGSTKDQTLLASVVNDLKQDFDKVRSRVNAADRQLLDEQAAYVVDLERELKATNEVNQRQVLPSLEQGVKDEMENFPTLSKMQIELMVNSFVNDFARVATIQFNNSAGDARMSWLKVEGRHHDISHLPDDNKTAQQDLSKIDKWYCQQFAYLASRLADTPEPNGQGSLLDNTLLVWTNELGKGNTHSLEDIPFVMLGNGLDYKMGRSLKYEGVPHNHLLMALAHGFGHHVNKFGNPDLCKQGPLTGLN